MSRKQTRPIVLTIAGSDSGGGAGIQADLKVFQSLEVHGTCAITCLTAQNPKMVLGVEPVSPKIVCQQIEAVFQELPPRAIKTGMLYSKAIIEEVVRVLLLHKKIPVVVDPVMISTSGAALLKPDGMIALRKKLLPLATLVTPNLDEASLLCGRPLEEPEDLRKAARLLHEEFGVACLVKGGHLTSSREAIDVFYDGREELLLSAPFIRGVSTHGTGCTYSAAIAAELAKGHSLTVAVTRAKTFVTQSIAHSYRMGKYSSLGS